MLGLSTDAVGPPGPSHTTHGSTGAADDLSHLPDHVVLDMLVGAQQRWLRCCRAAVLAGGTAARELLAPRRETEVLARASLARWKGLDEDELLAEEAESPGDDRRRDTAELSAARALGALACALAGVTDTGSAVRRLLTHAERANLCSTPSSTSADVPIGTGQDGLASVLGHLAEYRDHPAHGFAILAALELAGRRPITLHTSAIRVLFVDAYGEGHVAVLELTQVDGGPSGLHPDPARMSFLHADAEFHGALVDAWQGSTIAGTEASVLWSLTLEGGAPVDDISGASSGAAFAVALDYLTPRGRVIRRRIDPSCAITAGLAGDQLTAVGGYRGKLLAAQRHSLCVIVAAEGFDDALAAAPPGFAGRLTAAHTIDDAIRNSRTHLGYLLWTAASFLIACLFI